MHMQYRWLSPFVINWLLLASLVLLGLPAQADTVVFTENFESGQGNWNADNGIWDVGTPSVVGPTACSQGSKCAATVLNANYARNTNSRLVSPSIILPAVTGAERLMLFFQDWHEYSYYDYGTVQISAFDSTSSTWSAWQDNGSVNGTSANWSKVAFDLTAYAGKKIRLGFYHFSDDENYLAAGWYIDDVQIVNKVLQFDGTFETGLGDWYGDNGVWAIGTPTSGPMTCHTGTRCAGTVLDGNYPKNTNSRLVALAPVQLPTVSGLDEIHLRFWESHDYSYYDYGKIQISSFDSTSSTWSAWQDVGTVSGISTAWLRKDIDLTAYSGKKVRLGFYHFSDDENYLAAGWYIDDIEIPGAPNPTGFALTVTKTGTGTGTVTSAPAGINCGGTCSANFTANSNVILTAAAATGSTFGGWSGACTGTALTCTVAMTAAKTATANFKPATVSVPTATTNAATTVTATSAVLNGSVISSSATATASFDFGTDPSYGTNIAATPAQVYSSTAVAVTATKTGLNCGTTYYYRVKAVTSAGTGLGLGKTFTTAACATGRRADFVITGLTLTPAAPVANSTFSLAVTVKNQGKRLSDGGFLDVWTNQAAVPTCGAEGTKYIDVGFLNAGASKTFTIAGLPAGAAGAKTARAYVDSWCEIVESNETNNQMIKAYSVQ